jgi:hypothetical protein
VPNARDSASSEKMKNLPSAKMKHGIPEFSCFFESYASWALQGRCRLYVVCVGLSCRAALTQSHGLQGKLAFDSELSEQVGMQARNKNLPCTNNALQVQRLREKQMPKDVLFEFSNDKTLLVKWEWLEPVLAGFA